MGYTFFSYITYYLVTAIFIGLSYEVPLDGKNVRNAKDDDELPFVVSIEMKGIKGLNFCVGTLISHRSVLTAAHCLFNSTYGEIEIRAGSTDLRKGKIYQVESWISYDQWTKTTEDLELSDNDIAVITLIEPVIGCKPAAILTFSRQDLDNSIVRIAGWGLTLAGKKPMILKTAVLRVIRNDDCEWLMESLLDELYEVDDIFFCTKADPWVLGGCGDSGAPILNKQKQVVGIHRGVCPEYIREHHYTELLANQYMVNVHLHLHHFRNFIRAVKI